VPARSRPNAATKWAATLAAIVAVASSVGIVLLVIRWTDDGGRAPVPLGLETTSAVTPFTGYREVHAAVDGRCVRLLVAATDGQRRDGLRGVDELGPYAGMLFAEPGSSNDGFTMAGVDRPLDITWFAADGTRLDSARMAVCPDRAEADCPVYRSERAYRFALETPGGAHPASSIAPCM
jgi:uncharacterized membrane protein (UPF0127 family)